MVCIACYSNQPLTYNDGITLLIGFLGIAVFIITMYLGVEWYLDKQEKKKPKDALANLYDKFGRRLVGSVE